MTSDLHRRSLEVVKRFKQSESDLILILQEHEETQEFRKLRFTSLHHYCVTALGLSESVACVYIAVARKAMLFPVLQSAILDHSVSAFKARKIVPVLNFSNQEEWVQKAQTLSTRELEWEVAKAAPGEAVRESIKPVCADRLELKLGISVQLEEKIRRVQDLECQRTAQAVNLEATLDAALELYLERNDPLRKAARAKKKETKGDARASDSQGNNRSNQVPAISRHKVVSRDEGRCTHVDPQGRRCENQRWLHVHHVRHRAQGGDHSAENLRILCWAHHQMEHQTG